MEVLIEQFCKKEFPDIFIHDLGHNEKPRFVEAMLLILQSHRYRKGEEFTECRNFTIVRDPMYKFSNEAKERFFNSLYLSFFFNYFVINGGNAELIGKAKGKGQIYVDKLKEALMMLNADAVNVLRAND